MTRENLQESSTETSCTLVEKINSEQPSSSTRFSSGNVLTCDKNCEFCGKLYPKGSSRSTYNSHIFQNHGIPCHCVGCDKLEKSEFNLNRHLRGGRCSRLPKGDRVGVCSVLNCPVQVISREQLEKHFKDKHPHTEPSIMNHLPNLPTPTKRKGKCTNTTATNNNKRPRRAFHAVPEVEILTPSSDAHENGNIVPSPSSSCNKATEIECMSPPSQASNLKANYPSTCQQKRTVIISTPVAGTSTTMNFQGHQERQYEVDFVLNQSRSTTFLKPNEHMLEKLPKPSLTFMPASSDNQSQASPLLQAYKLDYKSMNKVRHFPSFYSWFADTPIYNTGAIVVNLPPPHITEDELGHAIQNVFNAKVKFITSQRVSETSCNGLAYIIKEHDAVADDNLTISSFRDAIYDYPPESLNDVELEEIFFKELTSKKTVLKYAKGHSGTLFQDIYTDTWKLDNLQDDLQQGDIFTYLRLGAKKQAFSMKLEGYTKPSIEIGQWKSTINLQKARDSFGRITYLHTGAPRVWYIIGSSYEKQLYKLMADNFKDYINICPGYLQHNETFLHPRLLPNYQIKFMRVVQEPKSYLLFAPGTYFFGFNLGFNVSESALFHTSETFQHFKMFASECYCDPHKVFVSKKGAMEEYERRNLKSFEMGVYMCYSTSPGEKTSGQPVRVMNDEQYRNHYLEMHNVQLQKWIAFKKGSDSESPIVKVEVKSASVCDGSSPSSQESNASATSSSFASAISRTPNHSHVTPEPNSTTTTTRSTDVLTEEIVEQILAITRNPSESDDVEIIYESQILGLQCVKQENEASVNKISDTSPTENSSLNENTTVKVEPA